MNFFESRPFATICATVLASLFVFQLINVRSNLAMLVILCIAAIALPTVYHVIKTVSPGKIGYAPFPKLAEICITAALTVCAFTAILSYQSSADIKSGEKYNLKARVEKIYTSDSSFTSLLAEVYEIENCPCGFSVFVTAPFAAELRESDLFEANVNLAESAASLSDYSLLFLKRNNIRYSVSIESESELYDITRRSSPGTVLQSLAASFGYRLERLLSKEAYSLANALLVGNKSAMSDMTSRNFRRAGISHLFALSGFHVSLVCMFVDMLLRLLRMPKRFRLIFSSAAVIFVMLFTGMTPSVMRAGIMVLCYNIAWFANEKPDPVTVLFTSGLILSCLDRFIVFDIGFILSFSATLGIVVCADEIFAKNRERFKSNVLRTIADSIGISLAAGTFVYPESLFFFNEISLASPISTLLFTPLIAIIMLSSLAAVLFAHIPFISVFTIFICEKAVGLTENAAALFSNLDALVISTRYPFAAPIAIVFAAAVLYFAAKKFSSIQYISLSLSFLAVYITAVSMFACYFAPRVSVYSVNTGQNDGFVLTQGNRSAYIDISSGANKAADTAYAALCRSGSTELDAYILTHYHNRHISAIRHMNGNLPIRYLLMPLPETEEDKHIAVQLAKTADTLKIKPCFFDPNSEKLKLDGFEIEYLSGERTAGATHPRIAFNISSGGFNIFYLGGYSDNRSDITRAKAMFDNADQIIFASHRPSENFGAYTQISGKVLGYLSKEPGAAALKPFSSDLSEKTTLLYRERLPRT